MLTNYLLPQFLTSTAKTRRKRKYFNPKAKFLDKSLLLCVWEQIISLIITLISALFSVHTGCLFVWFPTLPLFHSLASSLAFSPDESNSMWSRRNTYWPAVAPWSGQPGTVLYGFGQSYWEAETKHFSVFTPLTFSTVPVEQKARQIDLHPALQNVKLYCGMRVN